MNPLERLAEERMEEAVRNGVFDDLTGLGQPLELEDLSGVPEDLRAGYLLLKGAGCLPEEMQLKKRLGGLEQLIAAATDQAEEQRLRSEHGTLRLRYELLMERRGRRSAHADYSAAIHRRLGG